MENTYVNVRPVLSFGAALEMIGGQVELDGLIAEAEDLSTVGLYREIARIAADVYTRRWDGPGVVDGEEVTYGYLQEIYKLLDCRHVEYVLERLREYPREIRNKKAFIRTMLVNSVFEMETAFENEFNTGT